MKYSNSRHFVNIHKKRNFHRLIVTFIQINNHYCFLISDQFNSPEDVHHPSPIFEEDLSGHLIYFKNEKFTLRIFFCIGDNASYKWK